jgi:hypothetical protein
MVSPLRHLTWVILVGAALVPSQAAHAQVSVVGNRTGSFTYTFSVINSTSVALAALSLDIPVNSTLTNLTAPTGFFIAYDPNPALDGSLPGRVDFLEDADPLTLQSFDAFTTIAGFSFESASSFAPSTYVGLNINGTEYQPGPGGVVFPGSTVLVAAPEPGTLSLLALAGLPLFGLLKKKGMFSYAR